MRFFKDMKFWKKVTLICGIPLLLINMLIGAMSYTRAKDTARSSSKLSLYDAVNRMDISLTTRSRLIISSVEAIAEGLLSADALELPPPICGTSVWGWWRRFRRYRPSP